VTDLRAFRGLIVDGDGVLWLDTTPLPGLGEFFAVLRRRSLPFVIATNNATTSPEIVQEKLGGFGVTIASGEVLTSSEATAGVLLERLSAGARVLPIGERGLLDALRRAGFTLVDKADGVGAVVAALDRQLTYERLMEASLAIEAGALFVATNPDVTYPVERGLAPGSGAILAALEATTGVKPLIVGKPEPHLFRQALAVLGTLPRETLAIGDRIETDVVGAQRAGMPAALVLTGVTSPQALVASPVQPEYVFENLTQLAAALDRPLDA